MKRFEARCILLSLFFTLFFVGCGTPAKEYEDYSQSSGFTVSEYDTTVALENLEVLGRVWGYAKYHHPVFAKDKYNIDYELFELLPQVVNADKDSRNKILLDWVGSLGKTKEDPKLRELELAENNITLPDFEWLRDTLTLGRGLSDKLTQLRYVQRSDSTHYVRASLSRAGNPEFRNESDYSKATMDRGYMLLGLFRLWNMIEYYFPSRNITDTDWNDVLPKYIKLLMDGDVNQYKRYMAMLIAEVNDTHSLIDVSFILGRRRIPLTMSFVEDELIVDSDQFERNEEFGISVGDRVLSIDGLTPEDIKRNTMLYASLSNKASLDREAAQIASYVHRNQVPRSPVPVRIEKRGTGKVIEISLPSISVSEFWDAHGNTARQITEHNKTRLISDDIGYLYPYDMQDADTKKYNEEKADAIMKLFKDTKTIIVDMRGESPPFAFDFIPKYFMAQKMSTVTYTMPILSLPGTYFKRTLSLGENNDNAYKGKVVVLVYSYTQSAYEYTTMTFQALPNCTVVGSQTAGADGNVSQIVLPGRIKFNISGVGIYYPDMTNAQRAGVKIDHYVLPTIEGVAAGRDEVLEKAIELANVK